MAGHVIDNPLTGEHIIIRKTAAETGGRLLAWELVLDPGGQVPSSHSHPEQEECFTVIEGQMRFRVGWRRLTIGPGESIRVPAGTTHHFANAGASAAHLSVETRPALDAEAMLEVAAALGREQFEARRPLPRPIELALFMNDFEREVRAPYVPAGVVRLFTRPVAWLARLRGADIHYCRLRDEADADRPGLVDGRHAGSRGTL